MSLRFCSDALELNGFEVRGGFGGLENIWGSGICRQSYNNTKPTLQQLGDHDGAPYKGDP